MMSSRDDAPSLPTWLRTGRSLSTSAAAVVFLLAGMAVADESVFQPKLPDAAAIVHAIRERSALHGDGAVLFLLDEHLFGESPATSNDLALAPAPPKAPDPARANEWIRALHDAFDHGKVPAFVGRRAQPMRSVELARVASANSIADDPTIPDCKDGVAWAEKCAGRVQETFAKRSAVVLVTDRPPRVTWTREPEASARDACWSPTWHEEEVGRILAKCGAELIVVAPEASFGEDTPVSLARFLPWASRPVAGGRGQVIAFTQGSPPPDARTSDLPPAQRFAQTTSAWPRFQGQLPEKLDVDDPPRPDFLRSLESDIPSGFCSWEYARACRITRGACYPIPRPRTDWLDLCKRGELAHTLVPDVDRTAADQWKSLHDDALAQSTRTIVRRVLERSAKIVKATPIYPYSELPPLLHRQRERDAAMAPFELLSDVQPPQDQELRRWREFAKTLPPIIAECDAGARELETAVAVRRAEAHDDARSLRIAADATLTAYWLRTSAFHLVQLEEIASHPEAELIEPKENIPYRVVGYPILRVSELLIAYDGTIVDPALDAAIFATRYLPPKSRDGRLTINPLDEHYRAMRFPPNAMKLLSSAATERAMGIMLAATRLHDRFAQTPWDWMVYYDELQSFEFVFPRPMFTTDPPPGEPFSKLPPIDTTPKQPPVGTTPDPLGPSTSGD